MLSAIALKNKVSLNVDRCGTVTLPQFNLEGVVHKAACDRFPL